LSKARIAEIRERGMRSSDFRIGMECWMSGARRRCTDIGTRLVIAIKLNQDDDPSWYKGPPFGVCESTIVLKEANPLFRSYYLGTVENLHAQEAVEVNQLLTQTRDVQTVGS
jgi:hypothetical protein